MRVSLSPLPSLVFKYACTPRQHCAVGQVTSTSSQSSRKRKVLWNFTRLSSVVENIQRRTKTYASKSTLPRIRKDEVEPFVPWHMKRSLFPGDVSAPRRTEDKLCYLFCLFVFIKLLKKTRKREWTVLVSWRRRACAFSCDRCWRCMFVTDRFSGIKKVLCWLFSEFWFCLADERLCLQLVMWGRAESNEYEDRFSVVRTDSVFPGVHLRSMGVNSATGSTCVDVNNRSKLGFRLSVFS